MDCETQCEHILRWAKKTKVKFDTTVVESILDWGTSHDCGFTSAQEQAIKNTYTRWNIAAGMEKQPK